jgi:hypothetical protein
VLVHVFVYSWRLCDELITRPRSPTECPRSSKPDTFWTFEFYVEGYFHLTGLTFSDQKNILITKIILMDLSGNGEFHGGRPRSKLGL